MKISKEELLKCSSGEMFGIGNPQLPMPPMLMFDSICDISKDGGINKMGHVIAELVISPNLWFFDCHFVGDPVMPGCLGLDALWQLTGFNLGWRGLKGRGRALGVSTVKFTGEVLQNVKMATYKIDMKRILKKEGAVVGLADGILDADGKIIYRAENLKVGLFKS